MSDEALPEITSADEAAMRESAPAAPDPAVTPSPAVTDTKEAAGAEPKPEPKAEAKPEGEREPKTVPLAALLEERKEAKERERRMEERLAQVIQRFAPQQQAQQPQKPSVDEQPVEVVRELAQWRDQVEQHQVRQAQQQQIVNVLTASEAEFAKTTPDYNDAAAFLRTGRAQELAALGFAPHEIQNSLVHEAMTITQRALQSGRNPAEVAYSLAKARGYTGKKAEAQAPAVEKQIETIARGAAASQSLGTAGGAPNEGGLSLKALADMSNEDFGKISDADFMKQMMKAYS